ncbi:hypothetical protein CRE_10518 [Caenorhabditis remanei]|uniref:Sdz-33 F-box domain-containing protein n=1 Tax=Caenorhabditis remanei TaxID=31234 RepID=E3N0P0_CAERE|nr:hypothetical protein CRE_10518 [Caenorhabditis remanei]
MCDALSSLKNISELYIHPGCCPESFAEKALKILSPVTNEITMWSIPFENREEFRTFLKFNLDYLSIYNCASEIPKFEFSMDDVLIANPLKLDLIEGPSIVEDINQFFLNWLQNTIDSRMEHFSMYVRENVDEDNLLNELDVVPFLEERTFHYSKEIDFPFEAFSSGYDIERVDGKKATITFGNSYPIRRIDFYIWP